MIEVKARLELHGERVVISFYNSNNRRVRSYANIQWGKPITNQYIELIRKRLQVNTSNIKCITKDKHGYVFTVKEAV